MANRSTSSGTVVPIQRQAIGPADPRNLLMAERLLRDHGTAVSRTYLPCLPAIDPKTPAHIQAVVAQNHRQSLEQMLATAAPEPTLQAVVEALDIALQTEPEEGAIEVSLAALIDSRMKLPQNLPVFVEAAIYDLMDLGFQPAVVAAACQKLRRESTFFPEIAEIVAACRDTRARYQEQRRRVMQALSDLRQAERWLAQLNAAAPQDPAEKDPQPFDLNAEPGEAGW